MFEAVYSFACLIEGAILFPATSLTLKRLYQGSKSNFAYLLTVIAFADAIGQFAAFILYKFPNETIQEPNGYGVITNNYYYYLLSLQSWIFGMKYLWSGILCSMEKSFISPNCVKYIGWTGGLCYAIFMITCWCISMATFSGYSDITKLIEWVDNIFNPISYLSNIIWGVFNILSTIITIVGI